MFCDECKKRPANVHITKMVNGVKSESHLCEECAGEKGELTLISESKFSFPSLLTGLLKSGFGIESHVPIHEHIVDGCRNCGIAFSTFANRGFLGCSQCYTQFEPRLEPLIRRIHGTCRHTGKVPKRMGGAVGVMREIENLRRDLGKLVSEERYEEAAVVRDKIKTLEKCLSDRA